jgi:hypothetical protein
MKATYGFRATMTARPGPLLGDELQYQDEVPVGGTFRG